MEGAENSRHSPDEHHSNETNVGSDKEQMRDEHERCVFDSSKEDTNADELSKTVSCTPEVMSFHSILKDPDHPAARSSRRVSFQEQSNQNVSASGRLKLGAIKRMDSEKFYTVDNSQFDDVFYDASEYLDEEMNQCFESCQFTPEVRFLPYGYLEDFPENLENANDEGETGVSSVLDLDNSSDTGKELSSVVCAPKEKEDSAVVCSPTEKEDSSVICDPTEKEDSSVVCDPTEKEPSSVCASTEKENSSVICDPTEKENHSVVCGPTEKENPSVICDPTEKEDDSSVVYSLEEKVFAGNEENINRDNQIVNGTLRRERVEVSQAPSSFCALTSHGDPVGSDDRSFKSAEEFHVGSPCENSWNVIKDGDKLDKEVSTREDVGALLGQEGHSVTEENGASQPPKGNCMKRDTSELPESHSTKDDGDTFQSINFQPMEEGDYILRDEGNALIEKDGISHVLEDNFMIEEDHNTQLAQVSGVKRENVCKSLGAEDRPADDKDDGTCESAESHSVKDEHETSDLVDASSVKENDDTCQDAEECFKEQEHGASQFGVQTEIRECDTSQISNVDMIKEEEGMTSLIDNPSMEKENLPETSENISTKEDGIYQISEDSSLREKDCASQPEHDAYVKEENFNSLFTQENVVNEEVDDTSDSADVYPIKEEIHSVLGDVETVKGEDNMSKVADECAVKEDYGSSQCVNTSLIVEEHTTSQLADTDFIKKETFSTESIENYNVAEEDGISQVPGDISFRKENYTPDHSDDSSVKEENHNSSHVEENSMKEENRTCQITKVGPVKEDDSSFQGAEDSSAKGDSNIWDIHSLEQEDSTSELPENPSMEKVDCPSHYTDDHAMKEEDYTSQLAEVQSRLAKFSHRDIDLVHMDVIEAIDNLVEKMALDLQQGTLSTSAVMEELYSLTSAHQSQESSAQLAMHAESAISSSPENQQEGDFHPEVIDEEADVPPCQEGKSSKSPEESLASVAHREATTSSLTGRAHLEQEIYDLLDEIMSLLRGCQLSQKKPMEDSEKQATVSVSDEIQEGIEQVDEVKHDSLYNEHEDQNSFKQRDECVESEDPIEEELFAFPDVPNNTPMNQSLVEHDQSENISFDTQPDELDKTTIDFPPCKDSDDLFTLEETPQPRENAEIEGSQAQEAQGSSCLMNQVRDNAEADHSDGLDESGNKSYKEDFVQRSADESLLLHKSEDETLQDVNYNLRAEGNLPEKGKHIEDEAKEDNFKHEGTSVTNPLPVPVVQIEEIESQKDLYALNAQKASSTDDVTHISVSPPYMPKSWSDSQSFQAHDLTPEDVCVSDDEFHYIPISNIDHIFYHSESETSSEDERLRPKSEMIYKTLQEQEKVTFSQEAEKGDLKNLNLEQAHLTNSSDGVKSLNETHHGSGLEKRDIGKDNEDIENIVPLNIDSDIKDTILPKDFSENCQTNVSSYADNMMNQVSVSEGNSTEENRIVAFNPMETSFDDRLTDQVAENIVNEVLASQEQQCLKELLALKSSQTLEQASVCDNNKLNSEEKLEDIDLQDMENTGLNQEKMIESTDMNAADAVTNPSINESPSLDTSAEVNESCSGISSITEEDTNVDFDICNSGTANFTEVDETFTSSHAQVVQSMPRTSENAPLRKLMELSSKYNKKELDEEAESVFETPQYQQQLRDEVASAMSKEIVLMAEVEVAMEDLTKSPLTPSEESTSLEAFARCGYDDSPSSTKWDGLKIAKEEHGMKENKLQTSDDIDNDIEVKENTESFKDESPMKTDEDINNPNAKRIPLIYQRSMSAKLSRAMSDDPSKWPSDFNQMLEEDSLNQQDDDLSDSDVSEDDEDNSDGCTSDEDLEDENDESLDASVLTSQSLNKNNEKISQKKKMSRSKRRRLQRKRKKLALEHSKVVNTDQLPKDSHESTEDKLSCGQENPISTNKNVLELVASHQSVPHDKNIQPDTPKQSNAESVDSQAIPESYPSNLSTQEDNNATKPQIPQTEVPLAMKEGDLRTDTGSITDQQEFPQVQVTCDEGDSHSPDAVSHSEEDLQSNNKSVHLLPLDTKQSSKQGRSRSKSRSKSRSRSPVPPNLRRITGQQQRQRPRKNIVVVPNPKPF